MIIMISRQTLEKIIRFTISVLTIIAGYLGGAATASAATYLGCY